MITSDLHIHSEYSYDSKLPLAELLEKAREYGFNTVGVTDHVNYNDEQFLGDLKASAENVNKAKKSNPELLLGVELTPIAKPWFDHIAKHGTREGYVAPRSSKPYDIELAVTREELIALGVQYGIGAAHWRVDIADINNVGTLDEMINEWYRQQIYLACDDRVTVLGHPWWYSGKDLWYEDLTVIPRSMNMEIAAALKAGGKYVECNCGMLHPSLHGEKFSYQYAELMREFFELGIPVTYGSDCHTVYRDSREDLEKYLLAAGFKPGDIKPIAEKDLWVK